MIVCSLWLGVMFSHFCLFRTRAYLGRNINVCVFRCGCIGLFPITLKIYQFSRTSFYSVSSYYLAHPYLYPPNLLIRLLYQSLSERPQHHKFFFELTPKSRRFLHPSWNSVLRVNISGSPFPSWCSSGHTGPTHSFSSFHHPLL